MALCRVFYNPDGTVIVKRINPRRPEFTLDSETARNPALAALPFEDIDDADMPKTRVDRDKWRIKTTGNKKSLEVDNSVPDKPHPRKALLDRAAAANNVAELKQILVDLIKDS